ncbi:MAG TPA: hypothetical protein VNA29_08915 [Sphingomicrobium sp.]|nr:hypothetical protein [Sphingomicrobium sp.]
MTMLRKIARLFTIKTRAEAYLVTYAIAVGAVERGLHYLEIYPGGAGTLMFAACLGVPFIAGAKLLDSVRPVLATAAAVPHVPARRHAEPRLVSRNRPRAGRPSRGSALPSSRRTD